MHSLRLHPSSRRNGHRITVAAAFTALAVACAPGDAPAKTESADLASVDTAPPASPAPASLPGNKANRLALPPLSRAADSVLPYLVFAPVGQTWFTAVSHDKRMFVDVGRVDIGVRKDSARAAGYREAVERRGTVPLGTSFRLRSAWGAFDVKAVAADVWDGRIVLRLSGSPAFDSTVRARSTVVATLFRTDSATPATTDSCERQKPMDPGLASRLVEVRDSLERELRTGPQPAYDRLRRKMTLAASQVSGCFGAARAALVVTLKAANAEWVRERLVLVDTLGRVTSIRVSDYRFRAHDLLHAFDADGDGVDDLATRAFAEHSSATTVLVVDLKGRRATRLAAGFAKELQ